MLLVLVSVFDNVVKKATRRLDGHQWQQVELGGLMKCELNFRPYSGQGLFCHGELSVAIFYGESKPYCI